MKIIVEILHFIGNLFKKVQDDLAKASVFIVKDIQPVLFSGTVDSLLEAIVNSATHSNLGDTIVADLKKDIPIFLTTEGIIQNLNENSTEDDVKAALQKLLDQFPNLDAAQRAQVWTSFAANIYGLLHSLATGQKLTFGECVTIVEQFYQALIASKK